jgi:hypothetical protein
MNRNNYIYTWQVNRNPFIDYPSLADYIWGANADQPWFSSLSTDQFTEGQIIMYPNPANNFLVFSGIQNESKVTICNLTGAQLIDVTVDNETRLPISLSTGIYLVKISSQSKTTVKKLIVK